MVFEAQGRISLAYDKVYIVHTVVVDVGTVTQWQVDAVEHLTRPLSLFPYNKNPLVYPLKWILCGGHTQV